jgi:4-aminobutyrate aminotransferase
LRYIEEHAMLQHVRGLGVYAADRLTKLADLHPLVGDVRGLGLMLGVELVRDRATRVRVTDEAGQVT